MILVKNLEIIETDRDPMEIVSMHLPHDYIPVNGGEKAIPCKQLRELIRGRRFRRPDGKDMIIGMTRQVQDIIGIQYEAWDTLNEALDSYRIQARKYESALDNLHNSGFFKRLKMLFIGCR